MVNKNNTSFKSWFLRDFVLDGLADSFISSGKLYHLSLNIAVGHLIKYLLKKSQGKINSKKISQTIKSLEKREIINIVEQNGQAIVEVAEKGKSLILKYSLRELLALKQKRKKWLGKWFLVFFDVPELQRNKRDYLRRYLIYLGFFPYQKSVYLFPYECEKEIDLIKKIVEGAKYMKYIIAEKIEDEQLAKNFFKL